MRNEGQLTFELAFKNAHTYAVLQHLLHNTTCPIHQPSLRVQVPDEDNGGTNLQLQLLHAESGGCKAVQELGIHLGIFFILLPWQEEVSTQIRCWKLILRGSVKTQKITRNEPVRIRLQHQGNVSKCRRSWHSHLCSKASRCTSLGSHHLR